MMQMEKKEYRSPVKKLMRYFEQSRDKWKARCLEAKGRVKLLHTKVADLQASRERWKEFHCELLSLFVQREREAVAIFVG